MKTDMDKEKIKQEFRELNKYLDILCNYKEKDSGNLWIQFTDKFNFFKRDLLNGEYLLPFVPAKGKEEISDEIISAKIIEKIGNFWWVIGKYKLPIIEAFKELLQSHSSNLPKESKEVKCGFEKVLERMKAPYEIPENREQLDYYYLIDKVLSEYRKFPVKEEVKEQWISVDDRLPVEIREDGKRFSKWVFAYNKKSRNKAIYYSTKFEVCQWDDLDIDELPDCVESIDEEFYLKEGWYNEFEHNGDLMQVPMYNVTHWMPLPPAPVNIIDKKGEDND